MSFPEAKPTWYSEASIIMSDVRRSLLFLPHNLKQPKKSDNRQRFNSNAPGHFSIACPSPLDPAAVCQLKPGRRSFWFKCGEPSHYSTVRLSDYSPKSFPWMQEQAPEQRQQSVYRKVSPPRFTWAISVAGIVQYASKQVRRIMPGT